MAITEEGKKALEGLGEIFPKLSEVDKIYLLGIGEGMGIKKEHIEKPNKTEERILA